MWDVPNFCVHYPLFITTIIIIIIIIIIFIYLYSAISIELYGALQNSLSCLTIHMAYRIKMILSYINTK